MGKPPSVDYDKFISLGGLNLCHYMEPVVNAPDVEVSLEVLRRMQSELPRYDEYHLVYALMLGVKRLPDAFVRELPRYLAHEQGSVWSTALRGLEDLPADHVTEEIVQSVRDIHHAYPQRRWIAEVLTRLEERLHDK